MLHCTQLTIIRAFLIIREIVAVLLSTNYDRRKINADKLSRDRHTIKDGDENGGKTIGENGVGEITEVSFDDVSEVVDVGVDVTPDMNICRQLDKARN